MNEKMYKTMGITGVSGITVGIVMIVVGVAAGIVAIVSGARLLNDRKGLTF